jgi:hypothetical protein
MVITRLSPRLSLAVVAALGLAAAGAAAQGLSPTPITPPGMPPATGSSQQEWERAERAREQLNYQRERDRLDLERRALRNDAIREGDDRGLLGAPTVVQPGGPYAAPQYPYAGSGYVPPGTYGPSTGGTYGPGYGVPPGPIARTRACQQTAPAYDESGHFLATVCVR